MNKEQRPEPTANKSNIEQQALEKLKSGQYKDAIGLYTQRIKEADNEQLRLKVSGYLEKAKAFNLGDKYKELFVAGEEEQKKELQPVEPEAENIAAQALKQIQSGHFDQLPAILNQLTAHHLDKQYPDLAEILGLLMLTKHSEFTYNLPPDSAFIKHFNNVQIALQACQNDDQGKLIDTLKTIPFRSAFKDLCVVLNATFVESCSFEKRQSLLRSISEQSAYFSLAQLLLACNKKGAALAKDLFSFNYSQRFLIEQIKNFNQQQIEFITHLLRQYEELSTKQQFSMAIQYQALFGSELAEHFCEIKLAYYSAGYNDYIKHFGAVNEIEELRIKALNCEQEDNFYDAEYYWRQCIGMHNREEEGGYKIALILRHIADDQQDVDAQIDYLAESLQYDSDDRDTYLHVLHYYANEQQVTYQHWLSKALDQFPLDADFLTLATQVAGKHKEFVQAVKFAQRLLQIDPLSSVAKQTLFSVYLRQAKQWIVEKKYTQAEQQLVEIEQLNLANSFKAQVQLIQGFLAFIQGKDKDDITKALQVLYNDAINQQFKASVEAYSLGVSTTDDFISIKQESLSSEGLSQLIEQIELYASDASYHTYLQAALDQIKITILDTLQQQNYDEVLWLSLSKQLYSIQQYDLLNSLATQALEKWQQPVWVYYHVISETKHQAELCSLINLRRLQQSLQQAREEKDSQSILLIEEFLYQYKVVHPGKVTQFFQKLLSGNQAQSTHDAMEQLFGNLSDEILLQLNEPVEKLSQQTSLEQLAQALNPDNDDLLLAMMQEPDLFNALIVVKAAEQSGIDINVSFDTVLECFDVIITIPPDFF